VPKPITACREVASRAPRFLRATPRCTHGAELSAKSAELRYSDRPCRKVRRVARWQLCPKCRRGAGAMPQKDHLRARRPRQGSPLAPTGAGFRGRNPGRGRDGPWKRRARCGGAVPECIDGQHPAGDARPSPVCRCSAQRAVAGRCNRSKPRAKSRRYARTRRLFLHEGRGRDPVLDHRLAGPPAESQLRKTALLDQHVTQRAVGETENLLLVRECGFESRRPHQRPRDAVRAAAQNGSRTPCLPALARQKARDATVEMRSTNELQDRAGCEV